MSPSPKRRTEILTRIKMRVLKHHFNVAGIDHNAWVKRVDERTPALLDVPLGDFENGVRELIAQLGSSHTVFYHERTNRLLPQHSINATLRPTKPASNRVTCWLPSMENRVHLPLCHHFNSDRPMD